MMKGCLLKGLAGGLVLVVIAVGWKWLSERGSADAGSRRDDARPIPVEVASIRRGMIDEKRVFSGSLEASARMLISPKVSGRVARVYADLGDPVTRGQVLIELESDEFEQLPARARAELAVAEAQRNEAENRLEIALRERGRIQELRERGISSESALDETRAEYLIRTSALEVAKATVSARESAVETAQIQPGDNRNWRWRIWKAGCTPMCVWR
ncbi:MAG: biotin/lipoyl-binding protein [Kiritimatiellia bacterium]